LALLLFSSFRVVSSLLSQEKGKKKQHKTANRTIFLWSKFILIFYLIIDFNIEIR
jgi:hypothetical protein